MYTPTLVPVVPADLPGYLPGELRAIANAFTSQQPFAYLQTLNGAPTKPREGMVVKADGTNWNPGSGAGFYGYVGGAWVFFSGGGGGGASAPVVASISGSYTPNCAGLGAVASFELTFTGNVTLNAPSNTTSGQAINIKMIQNVSGGWTTTLNAAYRFPFGLIPAWGVTAGDESFFSGYVDTLGHVLCGGGTKYV